jgi:hypothetical protein
MNLSDKAAAKLTALGLRAKRAQASMDRAIAALEKFYEKDLGYSGPNAERAARDWLA